MKKIILALLAAVMFSGSVYAQEVSLGADVVSRYIWRGYDFGDAMSVQPGLSVAFGDLEVGSWASYELMGTGANEHDFYASYAIADISLGITDYYFPSGAMFGHFEDGGAHTIEVSLGYSSDDMPVSVLVSALVYNDDDNSIYAELGYSAEAVDFFAGIVAGESAFYGTDEFAIVNLGISKSKDIKITDSFTLPMFGSIIVNPDLERTYFFVGFSF